MKNLYFLLHSLLQLSVGAHCPRKNASSLLWIHQAPMYWNDYLAAIVYSRKMVRIQHLGTGIRSTSKCFSYFYCSHFVGIRFTYTTITRKLTFYQCIYNLIPVIQIIFQTNVPSETALWYFVFFKYFELLQFQFDRWLYKTVSGRHLAFIAAEYIP